MTKICLTCHVGPNISVPANRRSWSFVSSNPYDIIVLRVPNFVDSALETGYSNLELFTGFSDSRSHVDFAGCSPVRGPQKSELGAHQISCANQLRTTIRAERSSNALCAPAPDKCSQGNCEAVPRCRLGLLRIRFLVISMFAFIFLQSIHALVSLNSGKVRRCSMAPCIPRAGRCTRISRFRCPGLDFSVTRQHTAYMMMYVATLEVSCTMFSTRCVMFRPGL